MQFVEEDSGRYTPVQWSVEGVFRDRDAAEVCPIPLGCVVDFGPQADESFREQAEQLGEGEFSACASCGAALDIYSQVDQARGLSWTCALCQRNNTAKGRTPVDSPIVDYALSSNSARGTPSTNSAIFLIDGTDPAQSAACVLGAIDHLPDTVNIGLVLFDRGVKIYEVGRDGVSACVFDGSRPPDERDFAILHEHERDPRYAGGEFLLPLHVCKPFLRRTLEAIQLHGGYKRPGNNGDDARALGAAVAIASRLVKSNGESAIFSP